MEDIFKAIDDFLNFWIDYKAFWKSFVITIIIGYFWFGFEFIQFGTLQFDRECDKVVTALYFFVIAWIIHRKSK